MAFEPIPLTPKRKPPWLVLLLAAGIFILVVGYFAYQYFFSSSSGRWEQYSIFLRASEQMDDYLLQPGMRCGDAPFAFPTTGVIFGLWDQSYGFRHRHQGLDIFSGTQPGVTPVYVAYPGYLTRLADWTATLIIRIPHDPLQPDRQIWTYYTHFADQGGSESYIAAQFPPGTFEVFVEAGTFLGYQGNYSGDPNNPTGLHLHFSVVKDDGQGNFTNELDINNTYDPTPYFNLPVNQHENPDQFPLCDQPVSYEDWTLTDE